MKAYLIVTGSVFALITAAHVWRVFAEHWQLATDPIFIGLTIIAAALAIWAGVLLRRLSKPG